jgi:hypothetical protein
LASSGTQPQRQAQEEEEEAHPGIKHDTAPSRYNPKGPLDYLPVVCPITACGSLDDPAALTLAHLLLAWQTLLRAAPTA